MKVAWNKLYPSDEPPFEIVASGSQIDEEDRTGGTRELTKTLELTSNLSKGHLIIGLLDNDIDGNAQFKGLKNNIFEDYEINTFTRKHRTKNIYALLLPCPENRQIFVSLSSNKQRFLSIEHYFEDEVLTNYNLVGETILNTAVFELNSGGKSNFSNNVARLNPDRFNNFNILFDKILNIIRSH